MPLPARTHAQSSLWLISISVAPAPFPVHLSRARGKPHATAQAQHAWRQHAPGHPPCAVHVGMCFARSYHSRTIRQLSVMSFLPPQPDPAPGNRDEEEYIQVHFLYCCCAFAYCCMFLSCCCALCTAVLFCTAALCAAPTDREHDLQSRAPRLLMWHCLLACIALALPLSDAAIATLISRPANARSIRSGKPCRQLQLT